MLKMLIALKKTVWVKPKWRILRIYTKIIPRAKLENLKTVLEHELNNVDNTAYDTGFLDGKLYIIKLLLKNEYRNSKR